jgi:hypothetical protein
MAVQTSDIKFYLTGGSGNTNPYASLGGVRSTTQIGSGLNNLWDNITGTNHSAGNVDTSQTADYRVIAVKLDSPLADASSSTLDNAVLKISASSFGDNALQAYVSAAVNSTITAGADENTAPTDGGPITFATIPGGGLALPTSIAPGDAVHIAFKRTVSVGSTAQTNNYTMQITGDTI